MPEPRDTPDQAAVASREFDLVVAAHERRLGQFLVQMVASRELAEDLLQETFLVAFRERERLRDPTKAFSWSRLRRRRKDGE